MDFDVIVIGVGLVGSSCAIALNAGGLRVAVVDTQRPPIASATESWDSRIYAISPGSKTFLQECGAWQLLNVARLCPVENMRVCGDDARSALDFGAYDAGMRELAVILENRELQHALWQALEAPRQIEVFVPAQCEDLVFEPAAARLVLPDGRTLSARLVVGADGSDSWVRTQAAIETTMRPYAQTAVVANFSMARPHRDTAMQWFQRDGVLALLPLPGERVSMVWSTATEHAAELLALDTVELAARVMAAAHGTFGDMQLITPAAAFPLRIQRVRNLVKPRLALIGDAAHNVHPLAGQGVNLGFRDARELARVLAARGAQNDCGDFALLRRYERARKEDIATMQFTTDTLQRLFNNDNAPLGMLRNTGLRLVNRQSALKNLLVRHAVG
ncbi:MAG: Ubiquinone biosynthesis hydroxylase, UbiH/UbiF/VisC/COQ6 family [Betaproteobacteria bacterium]|nr:Ubiquinone biosynthesis hydroxylase, UbiH/UbiF/VisC/COQ6 family [Betaproteobacteria bacterium]